MYGMLIGHTARITMHTTSPVHFAIRRVRDGGSGRGIVSLCRTGDGRPALKTLLFRRPQVIPALAAAPRLHPATVAMPEDSGGDGGEGERYPERHVNRDEIAFANENLLASDSVVEVVWFNEPPAFAEEHCGIAMPVSPKETWLKTGPGLAPQNMH